MANNIQWQSTPFNAMKFNPGLGFAAAAKSFQGINDTITDQENVESLARYRAETLAAGERKQDYVEGAVQRNRDEQQYILNKSAEQGILANQIASNAGGSHMQDVLSDAQNNPEYMALSGPERADYAHQALNQNKRLFSNPDVYRNEILTKLLDSRKFDRPTANAIATEKTNAMFSTLDKDIAGKLLQKPGAATYNMFGGGSSGSSGTNRPIFGQPGVMEKQAQINNFKDNWNITNEEAVTVFGQRILDWGFNRDPTTKDIPKYVNKMAEGPNGVAPQYALGYLSTIMENDSSVPFNIESLEGKDLEAFKVKASNFQAANERMYNTKGNPQGQILQQQTATRNAINTYNKGIMDRLDPDQSTREKRIKGFLSGLPGGSKVLSGNINENAIDVGDINTTEDDPITKNTNNEVDQLLTGVTDNIAASLDGNTLDSGVAARKNEKLFFDKQNAEPAKSTKVFGNPNELTVAPYKNADGALGVVNRVSKRRDDALRKIRKYKTLGKNPDSKFAPSKKDYEMALDSNLLTEEEKAELIKIVPKGMLNSLFGN